MSWLIYAGIVVIGAAGIHIFAKLTGKHVDGDYAVLISTASAFLTASCYFLIKRGLPDFSNLSLKAWGLAAAVGASITVAHVAIFYMYNANGPISIAMPIVRMGPVVIAVLFGVMILGEPMKIVHLVGILMAGVSIFLLTR
ncbi:MAG: EamA family transporter [Micavibrio sp.]|nr:EamA family transporter [Micavibrio sp.]